MFLIGYWIGLCNVFTVSPSESSFNVYIKLIIYFCFFVVCLFILDYFVEGMLWLHNFVL